MPRPRKPARLYERPDTGEWIIRDGGKDTRTGLRGTGERASAEASLARYLIERGQSPAPVNPKQLPINTLIADYAAAKADSVVDPDRLDYAAQALAPFWAGKTVYDITEASCRAYLKSREKLGRSRSTVRRELSTMRAALNFGHERLTKVPKVWLPAETEPRPEWHTRDQFAATLWQLWRQKSSQHAARISLCQFYTGSRPKTIGRTSREKRRDGPWLDLDQQIWWRRGDDEIMTVKARQPHRIPDRLLAHLKRWDRLYDWVYVVEHPRPLVNLFLILREL